VKRELSLFQRAVGVPLGILWLGVIALLAVPVIIYMTALYHLVHLGRGSAAATGDSPSRTGPQS
jgi:hypothetical protein